MQKFKTNTKPLEDPIESIPLSPPQSESVAGIPTLDHAEAGQNDIVPLFEDNLEAPLVLVVEDHPINRELLALQIELLGLRTKSAENGRVAFSLWREGHFDMIISDCHMPKMDGYEMSRSIRKIEALEQRPRIPIIAWTANGLNEENQLKKDAGIDDSLVKPANLLQLRSMLKKWLLPKVEQALETCMSKICCEGAVDSSDLSPPHGEQAPTPIDRAVLNAIITDSTEQQNLLYAFIDHVHADRDRLKELLTQQDRGAVQSAMHRMGGSCSMVGAVRLSEICVNMGQAAKQGDWLATQTQLTELNVALVELVEFTARTDK
jgi:two-component system sensor histidine kinase EvgS